MMWVRISLLMCLALAFTRCIGIRHKRSHQVESALKKSNTTVVEKLQAICKMGFFRGRDALCAQLAEGTLSSLVNDGNTHPSVVEKVDQEGIREVYHLKAQRWVAIPITEALQVFLETLKKSQDTTKTTTPANVTLVGKPTYDLSSGVFQLRLRIHYPRTQILSVDIDNEIVFSGQKIGPAYVISVQVPLRDRRASVANSGHGTLVLIPGDNGFLMRFSGQLNLPVFGLKTLFSYQINKGFAAVLAKMVALMKGSVNVKEQVWPKIAPYVHLSARYKGSLYTDASPEPLCETHASVSFNHVYDLDIAWEEVTCVKGLHFPIRSIIEKMKVRAPKDSNVMKASFDVRAYGHYTRLLRSPNGPVAVDGNRYYRSMYYPPRFIFIHPIIQNSQRFKQFSLTEKVLLFDPSGSGGKTRGEMKFAVLDVDKPYYNRYLDKTYKRNIRFAIDFTGFSGATRFSYLAFDRIEYTFAYAPVMVPKVVVYGDFSTYISTDPGILTKSLLGNLRFEAEVIEMIHED